MGDQAGRKHPPRRRHKPMVLYPKLKVWNWTWNIVSLFALAMFVLALIESC